MSSDDPAPGKSPSDALKKDQSDQKRASVGRGHDIIADYLRALPDSPGVYRMLGADGLVLYVGKAKNLKKRVSNYTKPERLTPRIRRMVRETQAMEFVTTHTEAEALLLEANLIKKLAPRYNILLRDDKSFPQILVTGDHDFPQVLKHRGAKKREGQYFGPFASAWAVNQTLTTLQRAFLLRTCSDAVFNGRTRPCLLFQIKRCSAPCVDRISKQDYGALVEEARDFLSGGSKRIQEGLGKKMQAASDALDFEEAASFRDRIRALTAVQARQDINVPGIEEADVMAASQNGGQTCIQVFFFRAGRNFGNRAYYPSHAKDDEAGVVLEAFIGQFYQNRPPPKQVIITPAVPNQALVAEALSVHGQRRVEILAPKRGDKLKLVQHAKANAAEALKRKLSESATQRKLLESLAEALGLEMAPERIEVYDNSHVQGSDAVGAMIVAGPEGFIRKAYRKFTIKGASTRPDKRGQQPKDGLVDGFSPGDDFAMMAEVLTRRFSRALKEDPDRSGGQWPDLVIIDGGLGQLNVAKRVFEDLGIDDVALAAVAKGRDRHAGREKIFVPGRPVPLKIDYHSPVIYFIQRLRDESHRYVIGTHRAKRSKSLQKSLLDDVPGVGAKRKKALLMHFGSARAVSEAGAKDLEAAEGINKATAKRIYDWFHGGS